MTLQNLRLWAHERTPGVPRNVVDLETNELADVLGTIVEDQHSTVLKYVSQVQWRIKLNDTIRERFTKSWKTKTWKKETSWKKLIEKPIYLNKYPLPGDPESEKERLPSWLRLPRRARVAIRRLHRNLRHLPKETPVQMLRAARAPQDYTNAAKIF